MKGYILKESRDGITYITKKRMSLGEKICWALLVLEVIAIAWALVR